MRKPNEYILCAAIKIDDGVEHPHQPRNVHTGFVVTGRRHHNCYATLAAIAKAAALEDVVTIKSLINKINRDQQGFLTSEDRYVSRKEGFKIALANNQIYHNLYDTNNEDQILVSEDLY
jgi:hypothetical protein